MKKLYQADDGTTFESEEECLAYEELDKWVKAFIRVSIGPKSDLSKSCQDWIKDSDFEFEVFYEKRADIYKLAEIVKETSLKVYGHE